MGRSGVTSSDIEANRNRSMKFTLCRIRLDSGGYDSGGAYWGIGEPLYGAETQDGLDDQVLRLFMRATDRNDAKNKVRERFPNARFYR